MEPKVKIYNVVKTVGELAYLGDRLSAGDAVMAAKPRCLNIRNVVSYYVERGFL